MGRALIDTNIYSLAMRGDPGVVERLQRLDDIGLSMVSLGELLAGFRGGNREVHHRAELERFLSSPRVRLLGMDGETAEFYASVVQGLKRAGTPIPTNDIWIAALHPRRPFRRGRRPVAGSMIADLNPDNLKTGSFL